MKRTIGYSGFQGVEQLKTLVEKNNWASVLLITGKKSFSSQTYKSEILKLFSAKDFRHYIFSDSYPTQESIDECLKSLNPNSHFDAVISLGGGSVLDLGKLVSYQLMSSTQKIPTFIALPTTAGTGSERTQFATYYINGKKHSLDHQSLLPDYFILDPRFIATLPREVSIHTGLDALCQAVESYWNCQATEESQLFAREALLGIQEYFRSYLFQKTPNNSLEMLKIASSSGAAIQRTRTTAAHALSYKITWDYGVPHGLAVALNLGALYNYNLQVKDSDCVHPRGAQVVKNILEEICNFLGADKGLDIYLRDLFKELDISYQLSAYGIHKTHLDAIAEAALSSNRANNNPRALNKEAALKILQKSF